MSGPAEEQLPKDFGKYRLVRKIATGGMAEIFLAHRHDEPGQALVIKRILPHLAESSEFVSMFLDEARIAAQLTHPNIVEIKDVGQVAGAYYISMEYIHGEDVRRIYNQAYKLQRSLPLSHSIRVIAESALGLDFAHRLPDLTGRPLGVVHRDVSPQNILVTYEGGVKVVDFGIAKAANKVNQTRAGVLKGKYSYMSPEQALGEAIDHRTDIFALGIILYETTTGTRLFKRGSELATLQAVIKCEVTSPTEALVGYPIELEQIVHRALAKEPDDRYQTGKELSDDLYRFLRSSGLYVEPEAISEFMHDLFADRLAEERASGELALPQEHEIRVEMVQRPPSVLAAGVDEAQAIAADPADSPAGESEPEDTAALSPDRRAPTVADGGPGAAGAPGFLDDRDGTIDGTIPEEDREDLVRVRAARPRSEAPPAATTSARPGKSRGTNDQMPTVVNHAVYQDPPKVSVRVIEPERPERSSVVEETEFVRAVAPKRSDTRPIDPPKKRANGVKPATGALAADSTTTDTAKRPGLPGWLVLLVALGVFFLGLTVALLGAWWGGRWSPELRAPVAAGGADEAGMDQGSGEVSIITEPGATIWSGGHMLGQADQSGRAGPFRVAAGDRSIRVSVSDRGFERERAVQVRPNGIHEIEIRARPGWIKLAVAPWGRVKLDGRDEGITPLGNITVDEGLHHLVLENPDIKRRHTLMVRVEAGQVTDVKVDLNRSGEPL